MYRGTPPYGHPVNTATSLIRPPREYGHPVNTATPLIRPPR